MEKLGLHYEFIVINKNGRLSSLKDASGPGRRRRMRIRYFFEIDPLGITLETF